MGKRTKRYGTRVTQADDNKPETKAVTAKTPAKQEASAKGDTSVKDKAAAKKPEPKPQTRHTARYVILFLLIVVAAAGVAGFYGYQFLKQQTTRMDTLAAQQSQLQERNAQLKAQLAGSLQSLGKQQGDLANDIQTLRARDQHLRKDWLLNEAEYLLQLANYRLLFARDINTAVVALNTADSRLRETGDPGLIGVRKAIAESVQALKAVPQADLAGLSLSMSAITRDVASLPLNTPDPQSRMQEQKAGLEETRKVKSWSALPAAIWHDLKGLIIIRDHTQPVEPLLAPDQRFFLTENLRLQIEQARLAMLSGHVEVYKERLATAIGWINKYFDKASSRTQATLQTLKQLQASAIAPPLPDISKPYRLLEQYRQNQAAAAVKK
jgi:uroporphyrin-3 C-methyltransferase